MAMDMQIRSNLPVFANNGNLPAVKYFQRNTSYHRGMTLMDSVLLATVVRGWTAVNFVFMFYSNTLSSSKAEQQAQGAPE